MMCKYTYFYKPKNRRVSDEQIANIVDYLYNEIQGYRKQRQIEVKILNIYDAKISNFRKAVKYCELAEDLGNGFIRFPNDCNIVNIVIEKEL